MCELTQPNPEYPEETQLTETPETLYAISDLFERINLRANQLFNALEALAQTNATWHRSSYSYDDFRIIDGMVQLNGSYYSRCDGNETTEYNVNFVDFFDPEYLGRKQAEAARLKAAAEAKKVREEEDRKAKQEAAEREQYARLQAKFGG